MKRLRVDPLVSLLALLVPGAAVGQAAAPPTAEPPVLTLPSAISTALENNRKLASAALEVGKAEDRLGALKAQRWPSLSIDATAARTLNTVEFHVDEGTFGTYPGVGPIPGANTKITSPPTWTAVGVAIAKQPLSQLYKIGLGVKAREVLLDSAKEELREGRESVVHQVRQAYYAIVSAQSSLVAARESLGLSREIERVLQSRVVAQAALAHDEVDARAGVARAEYQVASLETKLSASKDQLNVLLGRDVGTDFRVETLPDPSPARETQAQAAERASQRPDVRRARLQTSAADYDAKLAKAEYLPDISATVSYFSPWDIEFQPKAIWSAGFLVQWDVFDGGKRGKDLAEKRKALQQARLATADAEAAARLESDRDWRRLRDAERLVSASSLARDAMRDRVKVSQSRYDAQASLAQDLLKAQADLAEADYRYNDALVSYWSTRADYEASIGEDL